MLEPEEPIISGEKALSFLALLLSVALFIALLVFLGWLSNRLYPILGPDIGLFVVFLAYPLIGITAVLAAHGFYYLLVEGLRFPKKTAVPPVEPTPDIATSAKGCIVPPHPQVGGPDWVKRIAIALTAL